MTAWIIRVSIELLVHWATLVGLAALRGRWKNEGAREGCVENRNHKFLLAIPGWQEVKTQELLPLGGCSKSLTTPVRAALLHQSKEQRGTVGTKLTLRFPQVAMRMCGSEGLARRGKASMSYKTPQSKEDG